MPTPHSIRGQRTNEELFFDHYPQILGWASQLARLDRADADDLVQDFYIQVTRISLPLAEVDEIEPYLFKILRNLHYSRLRQKGRSPISDLSIVDYDSLEQGLAVADRSGLFLVRANLKTLCEFACHRKHSSRAASIFILRFFLGYYSSEVMKVVQITRMGVDRSLQVARREAQLYLDKPHAARSLNYQDRPSTLSGKAIDDSHALFLELRQAIFNSCEGPHFQPSALDRHYGAGTPTRFTAQELAHLVSCRICLDRVNAILGLPLLDERSPDDTIGRDNPPGPGSSDGPKLSINRGTKRTASPEERKALDRKARQVFEHRPESLEICVNGETRTAQPITAEVSELYLKLNRTEEPNFIEVFSEQGIRLVYLHVTEPTLYPGLEQREHIVLSDGRSLDLTLSFANDLPTIHVVYRDPIFAQNAILDEELEPYVLEITAAEAEPEKADHSLRRGSVVRFPIRHWVSSLSRKLRKVVPHHMNTLFATALILASVSAVCFFLWLRGGANLDAHAFLDRAQTQEANTSMNAQPGVIFQKVRIKTPTQTSERTLYRDIQRRRRARERNLNADDAKLRAKLSLSGIDWNDPLSASSYRDWHNREAVQGDSVKRTAPDRITITTSVNDSSVVSESLTVRESDFHTVGKIVELRDYGTVEIAEVDYSVLPWSSVNPDLFEPFAEAQPVLRKSPHASLVPHLPMPLTAIQIDEAELGARLVLNRLHLDAGGRIELTRQADGVHVQGIVDTDVEKHQLQSQLYLVPHVLPLILTIREMETRPSATSDVSSIRQSSTSVAGPSAIEKYFTEHGMDRAAVGASAQAFVDSSFTVRHESNAITDLLNKFSAGTELSSTARTSLSELLIQHKAALLEALGQEERQLVALQLIPRPASVVQDVQGNVDGLKAAAEQNFILCVDLTSGRDSPARPAQSIAPQLASTIAQLRAVVLHISAAAQMYPPSSAHAATANQTK